MKHIQELDIHYHVFNAPKKKITYDKLIDQLGEARVEVIDKHIQSLVDVGKIISEVNDDVVTLSIAA